MKPSLTCTKLNTALTSNNLFQWPSKIGKDFCLKSTLFIQWDFKENNCIFNQRVNQSQSKIQIKERQEQWMDINGQY